MKKNILKSSVLFGILLLTGCSEAKLLSENKPIALSHSVTASRISVISSKETPESRCQDLMKTWEGYVLFSGWVNGKECGYDVSTLTKEEKEAIIEFGLLVISINSESKQYAKWNPTILANYHYQKKDYKKAMYWAFKGAENGSPECMQFLSNAYRSGDGLVQDVVEGIKWTYLAAAAGDSWCRQWVKKNGISGLINEYMAPILREAQKRASQWMNEHPEVFVSLE